MAALPPRQWLRRAASAGRSLRVLHWNILADCLAKVAPRLSLRRGFRCEEEDLRWEHRRHRIRQEVLAYQPDVLGLSEVDRFEDLLDDLPDYQGSFKRKRSPAKDGVAALWKTSWDEGVRRGIFLEPGRRSKAAQVAVLQRLWPRDRREGKGIVVCAAHLRASANENFRIQQASELVTALSDFARDDEQVILADVNSNAHERGEASAVSDVYTYFTTCGFRCAYQTMAQEHGYAGVFPRYTTWAGWAAGDYMATCDHIFVSKGITVAGVLDVPDAEALAESYPERLPCAAYPSDHVSLVADLLVP